MKFSMLAALVVAVVIPSADAAAQRDDQFVWGIGGGVTIPSGWADDNHKVGPHGVLMFGIGGVGAPLGIRLEAGYGALAERDDADVVKAQGQARIFTLMGNGVFNIYGSNKRLYAVTGLGGFWYNPDGPGTVAVNDFALNAGLGIWFPGLNGFVEARWLNLYRALPDPVTGLKGKKSARLYPVTLGFMF